MRRFLLLLSAALPLLSHADEAAPSLKGTWRAYVTTQGVVTGRTDTRYVFGDLGWAIRDATGTRPQDWYRAEDGKLLLRPAADAFPAGFDAADAALTATLEKGAGAFLLAMLPTGAAPPRLRRAPRRALHRQPRRRRHLPPGKPPPPHRPLRHRPLRGARRHADAHPRRPLRRLLGQTHLLPLPRHARLRKPHRRRPPHPPPQARRPQNQTAAHPPKTRKAPDPGGFPFVRRRRLHAVRRVSQRRNGAS